MHDDIIILTPELRDRLLAEIDARLPTKSFGYFISTGDPLKPDDYLIFETNIRNSEQWQPHFHSYGQYFLEHDDAGFVATPEESWKMQKAIWARDMVAIGVFHSHLRHPANFSRIDHDLHTTGFRDLWHLIISVRNQKMVQIRGFSIQQQGVRELTVISSEEPSSSARPFTLEEARSVLALDANGRPAHPDSQAIYQAFEALRSSDQPAIDAFLTGAADRYRQHLQPLMRNIPGGDFLMGSTDAERAHFVGETPAHTVTLAPFLAANVTVTNQLFNLFRNRNTAAQDLQKPAVDVTWFDAAVFALWMGARLPTEAEWEFACGGGSSDQWSCKDEDLLVEHAWYSRNAAGHLHPVAALKPNQFGLYDPHGNVWEWCYSRYHQDSYSRPFTTGNDEDNSHDKVCRGGSFHALSEMCRTRHRFHEPPDFSAWDLGFRVVKSL